MIERLRCPSPSSGPVGLLAIAIAWLLADQSRLGVTVFVILFGAGFGAITPARAALVAEGYGPAHYGSINGVIAFCMTFARGVARSALVCSMVGSAAT